MSAEIFVLGKQVRLLQPEGGFRTSLDSVMLASACPATENDRVLDLGCGVGGALFCLLHRQKNLFAVGIDIQAEYIELAKQNAVLNNNTDRCEFIIGNIASFRFSSMDQRVEHVICNPPFLDAGTYIPSPDGSRATALGHEGQDLDLTNWIDCAFHALRSSGTLTMIHRADYADRIIQGLSRKFGQVEIFPLWPRAGHPAKRVIIRARKDRRTPAIIHSGLVLHNEDGSYTSEAEKILRAGEAMF